MATNTPSGPELLDLAAAFTFAGIVPAQTSPTQEVRTSPKKARKPQARSLPLRHAILALAERYEHFTVRQLFYQLVSHYGLEKTDRAYKRVCDVSAQMRLDGTLHYGKVKDGHRTRQAVYQHDGLAQALESASDLYRRNYWTNQPRLKEVWCEKDALSGEIRPVCDKYGVTYVACRGFPSITLRYESALVFKEAGKPVEIIYAGDHDPSGRQISGNLERELRQFGADVTVRRVALDPDQIRYYQLPAHPGKRSDSRLAGFAAEYGNACVELDALPPDVLRETIGHAIVDGMDWHAWFAIEEAERLERETFASLASIGWQPGHRYQINPPEQQEAS